MVFIEEAHFCNVACEFVHKLSAALVPFRKVGVMSCLVDPFTLPSRFHSQGRSQQFCIQGFISWYCRERHWVRLHVL